MILAHAQTASVVALIVGYFAAHAAALLTHAHAPDWFQGLVTTVLTVLSGILPTVVWNPGDNWKVYLGNVFGALLTAFLAYQTKIPAFLQVRTATSGLGAKLPGPRQRHGVVPKRVAA